MPEAPEVRETGEVPPEEGRRAPEVERLREERDRPAVETLELPFGEDNGAGEDYARSGIRSANLPGEIERAKVEIDEDEIDVTPSELDQHGRARSNGECVEAFVRELRDELECRALGLCEDEDAVHDVSVKEQDGGQAKTS
jgi:hypothetical protein